MKFESVFLIFIATVCLFGGAAKADDIVCYTWGPYARCEINGTMFSYQDTEEGYTPNSLCRRTFRITVARLSSRHVGFYCDAYMDVPEQYQTIYSFSHSRAASGSSLQTPYIYGEGLNSHIYGRGTPTTDFHYGDHRFMRKAHTHPDDNHYSYIRYSFYEWELSVESSSGQNDKFGSTYLFTPKTSPTYIGLNRDYSDESSAGSGVCRFECHTISYNAGRQRSESLFPPRNEPLTGYAGGYKKAQIKRGGYLG